MTSARFTCALQRLHYAHHWGWTFGGGGGNWCQKTLSWIRLETFIEAIQRGLRKNSRQTWRFRLSVLSLLSEGAEVASSKVSAKNSLKLPSGYFTASTEQRVISTHRRCERGIHNNRSKRTTLTGFISGHLALTISRGGVKWRRTKGWLHQAQNCSTTLL